MLGESLCFDDIEKGQGYLTGRPPTPATFMEMQCGSGIAAINHAAMQIMCGAADIAIAAVRQLERRGGRYGLVSSCCGGGLGVSALFERI